MTLQTERTPSAPGPAVPPSRGPAIPFGPGGGPAVPPAWVPLCFLAAAGIGLAGFGLVLALAAGRIVEAPTQPKAVAAVHVGMLAFLTTAALGAAHQFAPVVGRRPLRSVRAAAATFLGMVATAWLLPSGFAFGHDGLVVAGGLLGALTVCCAAWNLSGPLSSPDGGVPVTGLRVSVGFLVVTVAFGVVYAFDRQAGWFPLLPHRVLAHAHLGLLGWLGLTYVSVAEKLWPMFLLAHRPRARSGAWAVGLLTFGVPLLAVGLLLATPALAWPGAAAAGLGLGCHLVSFASTLKHRRRALELLHGFLFASTTFLVVAIALATLGGAADLGAGTRSRVVAAEVAALAGWLGLAIVGHAHKIVPFIAYTALRSRGVATGPTGRPLLFADLFDHRVARSTLVTSAAGFAAVVLGNLLASEAVVIVGGLALALAGVLATVNLTSGPGRATSRRIATETGGTR